jgi:CBS domain-containing protein
MVQVNDVHAADPSAVLAFLKATRPFSDLDENVLIDLCEQFTIDFFPKGTLIFEQEESEVHHLHLISRGGVKVYLNDEDNVVTLKDFRGEGGYFGALAIIRGSRSNLNVETVEDTFCYLLHKDLFLTLIQTYPRFAHYYLKRFSEEVVTVAYSELRSQKVRARAQDGLYLFTTPVGDVVKRHLEVMPSSQTVQQAAAKMSDLSIGSLLISDPSGDIVGIATDNDLRTKVVAQGLAYTTPIGEIMNAPVHGIAASATCFDALLQMMNQQVHHLAVENNQGAIVGVITAHDIMVHQGTSPISLFREIVAQRRIDGLYSLSEKVPLVIRTLVAEGAKANNITRMIAVLNDQIVNRVLKLLEEELGPAPYPFCWLVLGSEGRQEQTFKTDQDNALIYGTPPEEWEAIKEAKLYFRRFGNLAIEHLANCGYPLCKGQMMASNPKWRKPYATWHNYFDRWMSAPEPQAVLHATIFFDFRGGYGDAFLADHLRDYLVREAPQRSIFLVHLAKDCLVNRPPLSFFRNFIVEKDGEHKNRLDIKTRGLVPYVDFGRLMALKHGIRETNTIARLQALADADFIPRDLYVETREAYEYQMQLRLVHQLRMIDEGKTPDNYIDPAELSDLEKQTLKEAFAVIGRIQGYIKTEMRVTEVD